MRELQAGEFHLADGLTVLRLPDGNIRIRWDQGRECFNCNVSLPAKELVVDSSSFASLVCAASAGGENHGRFYPVCHFLGSTGPVRFLVPAPSDPPAATANPPPPPPPSTIPASGEIIKGG